MARGYGTRVSDILFSIKGRIYICIYIHTFIYVDFLKLKGVFFLLWSHNFWSEFNQFLQVFGNVEHLSTKFPLLAPRLSSSSNSFVLI